MTRDAPTLPSPADADTGDVRVVAGRYALPRVLGRGGMGVVYEAENTWTSRRVALKVLDPARSADPVQVERFMREARATSALRHPNVVDVLDMGQDAADGALYIVQELLLGEDLKALLEREGRVDEGRARAIVAPVLKGLAAAHAAGIVHRDVKPANLFLAKGPDGEEVPKVIDFGIARDMARDVARTGSGETIGTPAYMAPEQLRAERALTPAVDVWALGVVLHEMLAGATPFPSENYLVLVHRVLAGERPPLETSLAHVSPAMRALVERALDAAVALERSNRLRPLPVVTWNLAIAYRGLGRNVAAVEAFERYLLAPEATAPPERLAAIRDELVELRRRVARVTLTVTPPEATLVIDGRPQGALAAGHTLTLDPGAHVFEWSAVEHRPLRREIAGAAGSTEVFNERLEPVQEGRLIVEPMPLTASVTLDGRPLGASRQELTLPPGEHWVELAAPGYVATRRAVRVGATGVVRLSLSLERVRLPGWVLPVSVVGSALVVAGVGTLVYFVARPEVPAARVGTWDNVQEPVR